MCFRGKFCIFVEQNRLFMRTLQIIGESPEALKFFEDALALPFVRVREENVSFNPMTVCEFNEKIDRAMEDYRAGRAVSSEEIRKRIASW